MRMIETWTDSGRKALPLPETGIRDDNGHLFHHAEPLRLLPVHIQRLEEHGIFFKVKRVTEEDNEKLRSNWREFAKKHNLEDKDLLSLINFRAGHSEKQRKTPEMLQKKEFKKKTFFWPAMCKGFSHKTAQAIRLQLLILFDPVNKIEGANDPLNEEEERRAIQMYRKGMKYQEIADHFQKNYRVVMYGIHRLLEKETFSRSERRKLWNIVCEWLDSNPVDFNSLSKLVEINWKNMGRVLFRDPKILQNEWNLMVAELSDLISNGMSWEEALENAVPESGDISPSEFADFVDMFIDEKKYVDTLHCTKDERRHLKLEMRKRGITGFKTGRLSEYKFCRYKMGRVFWAIRHKLLEKIRLCLPLSVQLRLISRCFRAFANAPCKVARVQLRRHLVVNELIRQMRETDPQWKPSRKLKKYIDQKM